MGLGAARLVFAVLISAVVAALVFGLGLIGYAAWGHETEWYLPLNVAAAVAVFLYALYENLKGERDWKRAQMGLPRHASKSPYLSDEERASIADPWERYRLSKQRADAAKERDQ